MTYFQATRPGYDAASYHTPERSFWCCTGSGMENHAKYGDSIYFHDADQLYVNLFIASTLAWRERGITLSQHTSFPDRDTTRLVIDHVDGGRPVAATILVRHPAWCDRPVILVNGRRLAADALPSGYLRHPPFMESGRPHRVRLPMTLRTEPLPVRRNTSPSCMAPSCWPAASAPPG